MQRDSILNTLLIAISVSLVCSFLVSSAAVGLRPLQQKNAEQDRQRNILEAAGFTADDIRDAGGVSDLFKSRVKPIIIQLESGKQEGLEEIVNADANDNIKSVNDALTAYNQIETARQNQQGLVTQFESKKDDLAGISRVERFSHVYLITDDNDAVKKYVFPIRGKGLWSILKGFIAVENDFQTIAGLTYYEHGETPGLGGEVDNRSWKEKWKGKSIFGESGQVEIEVIKGSADADQKFAVDGLSGATITSRGVTNMLQFWLGPSGFGPYISNQRQDLQATAAGQSGDNP